MAESKLYIPDFIYISHPLQTCEEISDAARIYCGQLKAITNRFQYCWATDEELALMKGKGKRTIQRWHDELEQAGFISRKSVNKPIKREGEGWSWVRTRKMFVYNSPYDNPEWLKKNPQVCNDPHEIPPDPLGENINGGVYDSDINGGVYDSDINGASNIDNSQSKPKNNNPSVVVTLSLDKLDLEKSFKDKIIANHSNEEIDIAVTRCIGWKSRPSDEVGIMTALRKARQWQDNPTEEQKKETYQDYLKTLCKYDQTYIGNTFITVGKTYIEFVSGMKVDIFSVDLPQFKSDVIGYIDNLKQLVESLKSKGAI